MHPDPSVIVFPADLHAAARDLAQLLQALRLRLAVAESCTGGSLAALLTAVPGVSGCFEGGVIAYSNAAKAALLGVGPEALDGHGAVSDVVAGQMAAGARERFDADLALATTGIAGPAGATPDKPVGLVFVALATSDEVRVSRCLFNGSRARVQSGALREALDMASRFARGLAGK